MNRLNYLMSRSWYNSRRFKVYHVDDLRFDIRFQAYEHWMREFWTYRALCRCIRRGYKPVREMER